MHEQIGENLNTYIMLLTCQIAEGAQDKRYRLELFL